MNKLSSFGDLAAVPLAVTANRSGRKLENEAREPNCIVSNTCSTDADEERLYAENLRAYSDTVRSASPPYDQATKAKCFRWLNRARKRGDGTYEICRLKAELNSFMKHQQTLTDSKDVSSNRQFNGKE